MQRFSSVLGSPVASSGRAPHLLILSYLPLHYTVKLETLFARSLQERGWKISILTTRATEPMAREYYERLLGAPILRIEDFLDFSNSHSISRFVDEAAAIARVSIADFKAVTYREAPISLAVIGSLTAMHPDGNIRRDAKTDRRIRSLLRQSALLLDAAERLYDEVQPSLVLCQEKGGVGFCETFYTALARGIDFVQWFGCHEPDSVMFKRFRPENVRDHPFSISGKTWARLGHMPWDDRFEETVQAEFDRGYRSGDWFKYKGLSTDHDFPDRDVLLQYLGLDPTKKTAVIYSHILNDANLFYGSDLFAEGYEQWLVETVRAAAMNSSVNWVLKLHPANVFRRAATGYTGEYGELLALRRAFGQVPDFLKIIGPAEKMSPLSVFGITDWGITVRGTVGVELPCFGIPVLTAGTGRYSGKGFTVDSSSTTEYLERVRTIQDIAPLTETQRRLGIMHAYFVFRGRPARYGAVFSDIYPNPVGHPRHRDIELRLGSIAEITSHPQMRAITDFLTSTEDDFLDPEVMEVEVCA